MSETRETAGRPSHFDGPNGHLLVQPRLNQAPQLTLFVDNAEGLAKLQSDLRDHAVALSKTNESDILLAAIAMTQKSALVLNVNAFMAAAYCMATMRERRLIPSALRELFNWVDKTIPTSDLDTIFGECRR